MKRMKSWWKDPNQTPAQVIAKRKVISKLIKEINISEPKDDGIPFFLEMSFYSKKQKVSTIYS